MERLRQYLDLHEVTQAELARMMGVKQPSVWEWLQGHSLPSAKNLKRLSAVTGLSIDSLLKQTKKRG